MDELNLESEPQPEQAAGPSLLEAVAFMDEHDEVRGVGIGENEAGETCVVVFADRMPAEALPESLDGLPVRVEDSDPFVAGG